MPSSRRNVQLDETSRSIRTLLLQKTLKNLDCFDHLCSSLDLKVEKAGCDKKSENSPPRRYPKRKVPKVCYKEEHVSSDDDSIYCDDCNEQHRGSCPYQGPLIYITDKKVPPGPKFARNTCPEYLYVRRSSITGASFGIWTEKDLIKGLMFGPYTGKIVKTKREIEDCSYAWEIRRGGKISHYVGASGTSVSNWMRFVNLATCEENQNMTAFQYRGEIYYRTYKAIEAHTELLVWYGDEFAEKLGIYRDGVRLLHTDSSDHRKDADVCIVYDGKKSFKCKKCDYTASEAGSLRKHMDTKHKGIKCYECQNCHFIFLRSSKLRRHVQTVHEKIKPHQCEMCRYKARSACDIRKHVDAVHAGLKPYKCETCDLRVSQKSNLRKHISTVHEGKRPYKCPVCDYRSSQAPDVRQHLEAVHEGIRRFKCPLCNHKTSKASTLRQHIDAVHEKKKPHECLYCDYKASIFSVLRTHTNGMHERMKYYKCQKCDFETCWPSCLRRHTVRKHSKKGSRSRKKKK